MLNAFLDDEVCPVCPQQSACSSKTQLFSLICRGLACSAIHSSLELFPIAGASKANGKNPEFVSPPPKSIQKPANALPFLFGIGIAVLECTPELAHAFFCIRPSCSPCCMPLGTLATAAVSAFEPFLSHKPICHPTALGIDRMAIPLMMNPLIYTNRHAFSRASFVSSCPKGRGYLQCTCRYLQCTCRAPGMLP